VFWDKNHNWVVVRDFNLGRYYLVPEERCGGLGKLFERKRWSRNKSSRDPTLIILWHFSFRWRKSRKYHFWRPIDVLSIGLCHFFPPCLCFKAQSLKGFADVRCLLSPLMYYSSPSTIRSDTSVATTSGESNVNFASGRTYKTQSDSTVRCPYSACMNRTYASW
jgi:hypothetical protein